MSFTYNPPTSLAGTVSGLNATLTWNVPTIINPPSLLLHMDGVNGSTTFLDSSGNNNIMTAAGVAAIDTSAPMFGSGALNLGTGFGAPNINTPSANGGPLDLSTGDFTIECWFKFTIFPGYSQAIAESQVTTGTPSGWAILYDSTQGVIGIQVRDVGSGTVVVARSSVFTPVVGQWNHLAAVRYGATVSAYFNGSNVAPTPFSAAFNIGNARGTVYVGSAGSFANNLTGEIDEFRITKGTAVYTANFTPPAFPFSTPPGYDVYRNGVSVGTFLGGPSFIDTVPVGGIYTYNVAAWDGTADISDLSAPLVLNVSAPVVLRYGKFAGSRVFPPTLLVDAGNIKPRVWMPKENITVKA